MKCTKCGKIIKKSENFSHLIPEEYIGEVIMPDEIKEISIGYLCQSCADILEGVN